MIQNQAGGHFCGENLLISTLIDCKNEKRFLCSQCSNTHQHDQKDNQHLIGISQFWNFISGKISSKSRPMKYMKQTISQIKHDNLSEIPKDLIDQLININFIGKNEVQQLQYQLNIIIKSQANYEMIDNQLNQNTQDEKMTECLENQEQQIKYDLIYQFKTMNRLSSSSISNQEQYLIYISEDETIQFVNIKMKKKVRIFHLKDIIQKQQFNNKSNLLFSGDYTGNIYCFNVKSNIKQLRKIKSQALFFSDLRVIKDRLITSSLTDKKIIVYDYVSNRIISQVQDTHYVYQTDYDYDNQIIVSYSGNNPIKFFNNRNEILIDQQDPPQVSQILQIQLIHKCKNLLVRYSNSIKLWQIMYERKCLVQLKQYQQVDQIYHFYAVCEDTKVIIITKNKLEIIDCEFNPLYETNHDVADLSNLLQIQQSLQINYILVMGKNQIQLFRKS